MYDDYDISEPVGRDIDASPVSRIPRLAGDEVDEERLIARLHAAIAKETGRFGLPWWQTGWAKGAMVTAGLLMATLFGLNIGQRLPGTPDDRFVGPEATILADWDRAYNDDPDNPVWEMSLDITADLIGQHTREVEARQLFTYDSTYPAATRDTSPEIKG